MLCTVLPAHSCKIKFLQQLWITQTFTCPGYSVSSVNMTTSLDGYIEIHKPFVEHIKIRWFGESGICTPCFALFQCHHHQYFTTTIRLSTAVLYNVHFNFNLTASKPLENDHHSSMFASLGNYLHQKRLNWGWMTACNNPPVSLGMLLHQYFLNKSVAQQW